MPSSVASVSVRYLRVAALCSSLTLPFVACRGTQAASRPKGPVTIPPASALASEPAPAAGAEATRCPRVPLKLLARAPGQPPLIMLTLGASGEVSVTLAGDAPVRATLDSKGCLAGFDGLWAELTPGGVLWTPHELFQVEGETIRLPEGAMGIRPDGTVERIRADGSVDAGFLSFEGYRDDARCAAKLLLATFMAMMPSMAVSDGHPPMAPVPADSLCTQYRRAGSG